MTKTSKTKGVAPNWEGGGESHWKGKSKVDDIDPEAVAWDLYLAYVIETGFRPPTCYEELLLFVNLSQCVVIQGENPPEGFTGVQIGTEIYVNGSGVLSNREKMIILAHEWAHWMRRNSGAIRRAYMYAGGADLQNLEEQIAVAFQRLF